MCASRVESDPGAGAASQPTTPPGALQPHSLSFSVLFFIPLRHVQALAELASPSAASSSSAPVPAFLQESPHVLEGAESLRLDGIRAGLQLVKKLVLQMREEFFFMFFFFSLSLFVVWCSTPHAHRKRYFPQVRVAAAAGTLLAQRDVPEHWLPLAHPEEPECPRALRGDARRSSLLVRPSRVHGGGFFSFASPICPFSCCVVTLSSVPPPLFVAVWQPSACAGGRQIYRVLDASAGQAQ